MTTEPRAVLQCCPFCGGEPLIHRVPWGYQATCNGCGAAPRDNSNANRETEDGAVSVWNTRVSSPVDVAGCEREEGGASVELARECFLNMIADATRWEEDVDGDCDGDGRPTMTIDYHLTVGHSQLQELCDVLGIKAKRYDETLKDAIDAAVSAPQVHP